MMNKLTTFNTFTASDAKMRFGELLDEALSAPVGITKHDRLAAILISRREFEAMTHKLQTLEDQLWLARAEIARLEGFVDASQATELLNEFRKVADDEEVADHQGSQKISGST